jgi:hypothetical protein
MNRKIFCAAALSMAAFSAAADPYTFGRLAPQTGSRIRPDAAIGQLPFDESYEQLTDEHRAILRSAYEGLAENDDPPYPLGGMKSIIQELIEAQKILHVQGRLFLAATVDAEGNVQKVSVYETPSDAMTQATAFVLTRTKFKAGSCGGTPCTMDFPVQMRFVLKR